MPLAAADLVAVLRKLPLLEPDQMRGVEGIAAGFPDGRSLARELLQRGWLTAYQINQLSQGRGRELLLGPYVLLERLGEGGMGQVFKARQARLGRIVAIKVIRADRLTSTDAVRRFRREIEAAAQLDHPNIVRALDADEAGGSHFFVMEFVEGTDLGKLVRTKGPLPVATACEYARQTALGLQHAYERGLVHRDIKPSNLLLTTRETVKILDMGLARLDRGEESESTSALTQEGAVMGTLDYIAPEQAQDAHAVDIRADLYSLGCTLYFLLSGRVPFPEGNALTKLLKHRTEPPPPLERLRPEVPPPVAAVVHRLMAKRPEQRYQTPAEAAWALEQALRPAEETLLPGDPGLTVLESPTFPFAGGTTAPRSAASQPAARTVPHRLAFWVGGVGLLLVLLVVGLVLLRSGRVEPVQAGPVQVRVEANKPWQDSGVELQAGQPVAIRTTGGWRKRRIGCSADGWARGPRDRVLVTEGLPMCLLGRIGDQDPPSLLGTSRTLVPTRTGRLFVQANDLDLEENSGSLQMEIDSGRRREDSAPAPAPTLVQAAEADLRPLAAALAGEPVDLALLRQQVLDFRTRYTGTFQATRAGLVWHETLARLPSPLDALDPARIPTDERQEGQPGELVAVLGSSRWHVAGAGRLTASADGKLLAVAGSRIALFDAATGQVRRFLGTRGTVLALTADGTLLASTTWTENQVKLWDVATGELKATLKGHTTQAWSLAFTPDGRSLACTSWDGKVRVWDVATGDERLQLAGGGGWDPPVAITPDGTVLATRGADRAIALFDLATGAAHTPAPELQDTALSLAFSPDGKLLASGHGSGQVYLWDLATGREVASFQGVSAQAALLCFTRDGKAIAVGRSHAQMRGQGADVSVWEMPSAKQRFSFTLPDQVTGLEFSPDATRLYVAHWAHADIAVRDTTTGADLRGLETPVGRIADLAFSPEGTHLLTGGDDGTVRLWDVVAGKELRRLGTPLLRVAAVAFAPQGRRVAAAGVEQKPPTVRVWDLATGDETAALTGHLHGVASLVFAPDGRHLLSGSLGDATARLWEVETGREVLSLDGHDAIPVSVALSPDGSQALTGPSKLGMRLWKLATGKTPRTFPGTASVHAVAFAPAGSRAAVGEEDGSVQIWPLDDPEAAKPLLRLPATGTRCVRIRWSPDGRFLATMSEDGTLRIWAGDGREKVYEWRSLWLHHSLAFAPDSRHLAVGNSTGTVHILRLARQAAR